MKLCQAAQQGVSDLLSDANFWFCFLILVMSVFLGLKHIISDVAFSALFTIIPALYTFCAHKVDIAQLQNQPPSLPSERGRL